MEIIAQKREKFKKQNSSIRGERLVPAVLFGKNFDSVPLTIDLNKFVSVYAESGDTSLIDIKFNDSNEKALVKEVQYDPVTSTPIHVGFYKVNLKEKIQAQVPVELVGEEQNELIKSGEAIALILMNEITVEALPSDLPHDFTIDVSKMTEVGEGVMVSQLEFDKEKVELIDVEEDDVVAKLDYAVMAEVEEEEPVSEAEALEGIEATKEAVDEEDEESSDKDKE